jgi:hypothetical protein
MPKDYEKNENDQKERDNEHKNKQKFVDDMKAAKDQEMQDAEDARRGTIESEG